MLTSTRNAGEKGGFGEGFLVRCEIQNIIKSRLQRKKADTVNFRGGGAGNLKGSSKWRVVCGCFSHADERVVTA